MATPLGKLTKLVEELAQVLEQSKELQHEVEALSEQVLESGIPELPQVEISPDTRSALELRMEVQQQLSHQQDVLDTVENITTLVNSVKEAVGSMKAQRAVTSERIKEMYKEKIDASEETYQSIQNSRKALLEDLNRKYEGLLRLKQEGSRIPTPQPESPTIANGSHSK